MADAEVNDGNDKDGSDWHGNAPYWTQPCKPHHDPQRRWSAPTSVPLSAEKPGAPSSSFYPPQDLQLCAWSACRDKQLRIIWLAKERVNIIWTCKISPQISTLERRDGAKWVWVGVNLTVNYCENAEIWQKKTNTPCKFIHILCFLCIMLSYKAICALCECATQILWPKLQLLMKHRFCCVFYEICGKSMLINTLVRMWWMFSTKISMAYIAGVQLKAVSSDLRERKGNHILISRTFLRKF